MVRMFFAAALAILGLTAPKAQERAPNPGTQTQLREWPISGVWGVRLIRIVDGSLGCWLGTGHANQTSGEQYLWGIRWRPGKRWRHDHRQQSTSNRRAFNTNHYRSDSHWHVPNQPED